MVVIQIAIALCLVTLLSMQHGQAASLDAANPILGLDSLAVYPPRISLSGTSRSQILVVVGEYDNGIRRDVTSLCHLDVSDQQVVNLVDARTLKAISVGVAQLTAALGALKVTVPVNVNALSQQTVVDFHRDIGGIFTRYGCNATECHGGVKGKGGFKLSLNALYPEADHRWLIRGGSFQVLTDAAKGVETPRIDIQSPRDSLLLVKATGGQNHGGGRVFPENSQPYQTLEKWIASGAPLHNPVAHSSRIERLELFPRLVVVSPQQSHQVLVTAHLASGQAIDMTHKVSYSSNNREVAQVSSAGVVTAVGRGETGVVVRAAGLSASLRVAVVSSDSPVPEQHPFASTNFIDDYVNAKLKSLRTNPSAESTDAEFLRRVCLDIAGTLPSPQHVRKFLTNTATGKRDALVEQLLDSPEYVDLWALRFADLFHVRGERYYQWVRDSITDNKPYDRIAYERLSAEGFDGPSRYYSMASKARPLHRVVAEDMRVFLGRRLDCAQCHDHPFEPWSQQQFWGLAAFYGRLTLTEWIAPVDNQCVFDDPEGQEIDLGMDGVEQLSFIRVTNPRSGELMEPTFLDGKQIELHARHDPRHNLANWVTKHPYFSQAIVNRVWAHFFGRGVVDPVDNFSSTHLPTHPELLETLAQDFRDHEHDLKHLIRRIVQSRTYQRSGIPGVSNRTDSINYARALPRPLDAEVLLDGIVSVVGVPVTFQRDLPFQPGVVAQVPLGTRAIQLTVPMNYQSRFLEVFGRPFRDAVPERLNRPNLTQALHMLAGTTYTKQLSREGGRLDILLKSGSSDEMIVEELYLAALCRYPEKHEHTKILEMLSQNPAMPDARLQSLESLLWSLLASREFTHNH